MTTENDGRRIFRSVAASIKRALGEPDRLTGRHARPKLESRNGYGSPSTGDLAFSGDALSGASKTYGLRLAAVSITRATTD